MATFDNLQCIQNCRQKTATHDNPQGARLQPTGGEFGQPHLMCKSSVKRRKDVISLPPKSGNCGQLKLGQSCPQGGICGQCPAARLPPKGGNYGQVLSNFTSKKRQLWKIENVPKRWHLWTMPGGKVASKMRQLWTTLQIGQTCPHERSKY